MQQELTECPHTFLLIDNSLLANKRLIWSGEYIKDMKLQSVRQHFPEDVRVNLFGLCNVRSLECEIPACEHTLGRILHL